MTCVLLSGNSGHSGPEGEPRADRRGGESREGQRLRLRGHKTKSAGKKVEDRNGLPLEVVGSEALSTPWSQTSSLQDSNTCCTTPPAKGALGWQLLDPHGHQEPVGSGSSAVVHLDRGAASLA